MTPTKATDEGLHRTYRAAGFMGRFTTGRRPAILVVDFCRGFTDPACPLGSDASVELQRTRRVLDAARRSGVPVIFTTIGYDEAGLRTTAWVRKVPSLRELAIGSPWVEMDPRLGCHPGEPCWSRPAHRRSSALRWRRASWRPRSTAW